MIKEEILHIEKVYPIFCDNCGTKIGDGLPDGIGGTNFWGHWLRLQSLDRLEMTAEIAQPGLAHLTFSQKYGQENSHTFVLCTKCALAEYKSMKERFIYYREEPEVKEEENADEGEKEVISVQKT